MKVTVRTPLMRVQPAELHLYFGQIGSTDEEESQVAARQCVTLSDARGEFVQFNDELSAINFIEKNGWQLVSVVNLSSDNYVLVYFFRKRSIENGE